MAGTRPWVLLSKPVRAPFRDGTSVLVRNLVQALPPSLRILYFGDPDAPVRALPGEVLDAPAFGYQPRLRDKARILARLASPRLARSPIHSFFAPNRLSATVLAGLGRLPPRPIMQTLPASTGAPAIAPLLRRLDRVVVTSRWGRRRLLDAGLAEHQVVCIYPGVAPSPDPREVASSERRSVLFAGDLDLEVVSRLVRLAARLEGSDWQLVIASRPKGPEHASARARLASDLAGPRRAGRVVLHGEVPNFRSLLDEAAIQVYLATHARRKVDLPLVLLEGLAAGVPAAVLDSPPVSELAQIAHDSGHEAVVPLDGRDFDRGLDTLMAVLQHPDRLAALRPPALALAHAHFSASAMADAYLRQYEALA